MVKTKEIILEMQIHSGVVSVQLNDYCKEHEDTGLTLKKLQHQGLK